MGIKLIPIIKAAIQANMDMAFTTRFVSAKRRNAGDFRDQGRHREIPYARNLTLVTFCRLRETARMNSSVAFTSPAVSTSMRKILSGTGRRTDAARSRRSGCSPLILGKTAARDVDPWGWLDSTRDILRRIPNTEEGSVHYSKTLKQGAIQTAAYCAGVKCKGYRLA